MRLRLWVVTAIVLGLLGCVSAEASNTTNIADASGNSTDTLIDTPGNGTAGNSTNGTAGGLPVEEIKFKNCAFHPDTFEPDKTPRDVLIRCYTKIRWESIDLLIENERLVRRFDYFNNKHRKVKREHDGLLVEYDLTTEKMLLSRKLLREERLDYNALLVALKIEYHELTSRQELHTRFGTVGRTFLTQEEIFRENALAQKSNHTQEQNLAMRTAVDASGAILEQKQQEGKAPIVPNAPLRRLLSRGRQLDVIDLGGAENGAEDPTAKEKAEEPESEEPAAVLEPVVDEEEKELESAEKADKAKSEEDAEKEVEEAEMDEKEQALSSPTAAPGVQEDPEDRSTKPKLDTTVADDLNANENTTNYMSFNKDNTPPGANIKPYTVDWQNASALVPLAIGRAAIASAEFAAAKATSSALTAAVAEGGSMTEIVAVVPQKVMEIHVEQKVIIEEKLVVAQEKAVQLQANATAANNACVQAEELAKANPSNDDFQEQKREACAKAQEFADAVRTSQAMLSRLQREVQQAQQAAITSTVMAEEAKALGKASIQLEQETKEEKATQAMAAKAQSHLEGLLEQQPPLETQIARAKQAVIDCGEPSQPEAVVELNEKRELVETLEKKLVVLMDQIAAAQGAVAEVETKLGGVEANRAKVLGQLAESSQQEEKLNNEMKMEEKKVELVKKELRSKSAKLSELMIRVRGAKVAMENAKLDHADRNSEQSGITVEIAAEEYNRILALAKAAGANLKKIQEKEALDMIALHKSREAKAAATAMREKLAQAAKPKVKGPDPSSAAGLAEAAEAEKANSAVAKAAAAAANKAAAKSKARAAAAAAEANKFAAAEKAAAAEADAKKARMRAMMALDDPNKMHPMILSAKMEGAVKEHSGLTDSNKMLTNRDSEVEGDFKKMDANAIATSQKLLKLQLEYSESDIRLKSEIRKTNGLKPAIGGEGLCMSCQVQLPEPGAESTPATSQNTSSFAVFSK